LVVPHLWFPILLQLQILQGNLGYILISLPPFLFVVIYSWLSTVILTLRSVFIGSLLLLVAPKNCNLRPQFATRFHRRWFTTTPIPRWPDSPREIPKELRGCFTFFLPAPALPVVKENDSLLNPLSHSPAVVSLSLPPHFFKVSGLDSWIA